MEQLLSHYKDIQRYLNIIEAYLMKHPSCVENAWAIQPLRGACTKAFGHRVEALNDVQ